MFIQSLCHQVALSEEEVARERAEVMSLKAQLQYAEGEVYRFRDSFLLIRYSGVDVLLMSYSMVHVVNKLLKGLCLLKSYSVVHVC